MVNLSDIDLIDKETKTAILRAIAVAPNDYIHEAIYYPAHKHTKSITKAFKSTARKSLGQIEKLPLELIWQLCLHHMDIISLFKFRQVNRRARQLTDTKEYRKMTRFGISAFRALLITELGDKVTLIDFRQLQNTKNCRECGKHGGFVFLPTWQRCCFKCAMTSDVFNVQPLPIWRSGTSLDNVDATFMSQVRTFQGPKPRSKGLAAQSRETLAAVGHAHSINEKETKLLLSPSTLSELNNRHGSKFRYRAVTVLPYLDETLDDRLIPTVNCAACLFPISIWDLMIIPHSRHALTLREEYTPDELLTQFKESCKGAIEFWDIENNCVRNSDHVRDHPCVRKLNELAGCPILMIDS